MNLNFLPDSLLAALRRNIPDNIQKYKADDKAWLDEYVRSENLPDPAQSGIEITDLPALLLDNGKPVSDTDAATRVHECFRKLKPVQAADERLWSYLCHCEPLYGYVRARWIKQDGELNENAVLRRFFFESKGLRGLTRNALSRLWWYGYLTHEDGAAEPYLHTGMLLEYQDTPVGLLERSLGKNPEIVKRVSHYIHENAKDWSDRSHTIQKLIRNINAAGGAVVLDALNDANLKQLCRRCTP
ncbi:hypothetical protein SCL_2495 [Sulfuricaulis limicola]|uniref:Uncharacterized protein n=1 Tax=Sulfuricaulis limicola TaxID=1620215 RepID=A0A1B4XIZ9_9GAMM|nr:DUF6339 family protein [Sulfuricaulis limicola]BAV34772.1 hypothetical protein SCL_2495 [Sulfuricaulis limicola]